MLDNSNKKDTLKSKKKIAEKNNVITDIAWKHLGPLFQIKQGNREIQLPGIHL